MTSSVEIKKTINHGHPTKWKGIKSKDPESPSVGNELKEIVSEKRWINRNRKNFQYMSTRCCLGSYFLTYAMQIIDALKTLDTSYSFERRTNSSMICPCSKSF